MAFKDAWGSTKAVEKGFVNNPNDKGGPTNKGITERVARANGYMGDMKDLPDNIAETIAKTQYWDILRLDSIDALSQAISAELFDTGFLCGIGNAGTFLQQSLNLLNNQGKIYGDITEDGVVGPVTVDMLKSYLSFRKTQDGERVMLVELNVLQGNYLNSLAKRTPTQEEFLYGWLRNRVAL